MNELKPCPFCGNEYVQIKGRHCPWAQCHRCDAAGPRKADLHDAIAAWNRRTPAPANVCPLPKIQCSGEEAPVGTFTCPPSCRAKEVTK
jgi:Lar family restriction alleviation protein